MSAHKYFESSLLWVCLTLTLFVRCCYSVHFSGHFDLVGQFKWFFKNEWMVEKMLNQNWSAHSFWLSFDSFLFCELAHTFIFTSIRLHAIIVCLSLTLPLPIPTISRYAYFKFNVFVSLNTHKNTRIFAFPSHSTSPQPISSSCLSISLVLSFALAVCVCVTSHNS